MLYLIAILGAAVAVCLQYNRPKSSGIAVSFKWYSLSSFYCWQSKSSLSFFPRFLVILYFVLPECCIPLSVLLSSEICHLIYYTIREGFFSILDFIICTFFDLCRTIFVLIRHFYAFDGGPPESFSSSDSLRVLTKSHFISSSTIFVSIYSGVAHCSAKYFWTVRSKVYHMIGAMRVQSQGLAVLFYSPCMLGCRSSLELVNLIQD